MLEPLLPRLKREIASRMDELRPLVAEAERLEAAKAALLAEAEAQRAERARPRRKVRESERLLPRNGAGLLSSADAPARANGSRSSAGANGNGAGHDEAGGSTRDAVVAIVEERPGVSVAEICAVTKLDKSVVAATVSRLKREGVLADEAGGVKLASRQPVTLAQAAAAPAPSREDGVSDEEWEAAARRDAAA